MGNICKFFNKTTPKNNFLTVPIIAPKFDYDIGNNVQDNIDNTIKYYINGNHTYKNSQESLIIL